VAQADTPTSYSCTLAHFLAVTSVLLPCLTAATAFFREIGRTIGLAILGSFQPGRRRHALLPHRHIAHFGEIRRYVIPARDPAPQVAKGWRGGLTSARGHTRLTVSTDGEKPRGAF
jgi:hypothetical protein